MTVGLQVNNEEVNLLPKFDKVSSRLNHRQAHPLRCVARGETTSTHLPDFIYYALALALLYDSADEAFSDLDAYRELNQAINLQSSPQPTHSIIEYEDSGNLQRALSEFLRGMPVDQACRQYGTERQALEPVLRVATKNALERRI